MKSADYWRDRWAQILVENGPIQDLSQEDLDVLAAQHVHEIQADAFREAADIAATMTRDQAGKVPNGEPWKAYAKSRKDAVDAIEARAAELEKNNATE